MRASNSKGQTVGKRVLTSNYHVVRLKERENACKQFKGANRGKRVLTSNYHVVRLKERENAC